MSLISSKLKTPLMETGSKLLALHLDHTLGIDVLVAKCMKDQFCIVVQTYYTKALLMGKLFPLKKEKTLAT